MGWFNRIGLPKGAKETAAACTMAAPTAGRILPQKDIPDMVIASGMLGIGCGIVPEEETLISPADAVVTQVFPGAYGLGLETREGIRLLLHVGIDTVTMEGRGFAALVSPGQQVRRGEALLTFSRRHIRESGCRDVVCLLVSNGDAFTYVKAVSVGTVAAGQPLLVVGPPIPGLE